MSSSESITEIAGAQHSLYNFPLNSEKLMELFLNGKECSRHQNEWLETGSCSYFSLAGKAYIWRGAVMKDVDGCYCLHMVGEMMVWELVEPKRATKKHHMPVVLRDGVAFHLETDEQIRTFDLNHWDQNEVFYWAQEETRKVFVEGIGQCILSRVKHTDDDLIPLHEIAVFTGRPPLVEMVSVQDITKFPAASHPIDEEFNKLLSNPIIIVSTLDMAHLGEFFNSHKEFMMIDIDNVRVGASSEYNRAIDVAPKNLVLLFREISESRDQTLISELLERNHHMLIIANDTKQWLPDEAVHFKPRLEERESQNADGKPEESRTGERNEEGVEVVGFEVVDTTVTGLEEAFRSFPSIS